MSYKEYKVRFWDDRSIIWYNQKGELHREDGPAVTWANGDKSFCLNGKGYTEEEYWEKVKPAKEVTIKELEQKLGYKIKIIKE